MMRVAWVLGIVVGASGLGCFAEPADGCSTDAASCGAADTTGDASTTGDSATSTGPSMTTSAMTTSAMTSTTEPMADSSGGDDSTPVTTDGSSGEPSDGSSTGEALCGNRVLDPDEECDGTDACTDCELDNFDCNPLNNAGCPENAKCSFHDESGLFQCLPFLMDPPGQLHEGSCYSGGPLDAWCDVGLACMPGQTNGACKDGGCCVEFCDIFDEDFVCAQKGDDCLVWFPPDAPAGLEWLGVCATP